MKRTNHCFPAPISALIAGLALLLLAALPACGDDPLPGPGAEDAVADFVMTDGITFPDGTPTDGDTTPGPDGVADVEVMGGDADASGADVVADADAGALDVVADGDATGNGDATGDGGTATDTGVDVAPACTPVPFVAPQGPTGWDHTTTKLWMVGTTGSNHRGQDVVTTADGPQLLIGKFTYITPLLANPDKDIHDEEVEVFIQEDAPCGTWVSQGVFLTSENGEYGNQYPIEDDGGRVFWELTGSARKGVGVHPVAMLARGDNSVALFNLFVFEPETQAVIFDIDGTLTTSDFELVPSIINELFDGTYVPEMYTDGQTATQMWFDKGYQLIFLSARPDFLKEMTRDSLKTEVFPAALLHNSDTNKQFVSDAAAYKTAFINLLKTQGKLDIVAVYGNATTDIEAYEAVGHPKDKTFIIGEFAGDAGTTALPNYTDHLPWIAAQPAATMPAPTPRIW